MRHHPCRAFTLVELLVVIAIIAILAAVLFPVFAQAKSAAMKTRALSHLKQTGTAWTLYNQDFDGTLMRDHTVGGAMVLYWWGSWDGVRLRPEEGLLFPYTRDGRIQDDPAFPRAFRGALGLTGFGYNYAYLSPTEHTPPTFAPVPVPVTESQVCEPSATVLFATSARINNWAYAAPTLEGNTYIDPPSSQFPGFHGRHNRAGLVQWADTHVKARRPVMRHGSFGFGFHSADFDRANLGEIDADGDLTTDELFDLQ